MSNCPFCNLESSSDSSAPNPPHQAPNSGSRPTRILRRIWQSIQWLFPTILLALMPKCPLCIAAYVALFTGIGISVSTATILQRLCLLACSASLLYLALRFWITRSKSRKSQASATS
jgi:hypothetical protein